MKILRALALLAIVVVFIFPPTIGCKVLGGRKYAEEVSQAKNSKDGSVDATVAE